MEGFKALEDLPLGQDIMPTLLPIAAALYDGTLHTNCSACFSPLPANHAFGPVPQQVPDNASTVLYCSLRCSLLDSYLHISPAEHNLLSFLPNVPNSVHLRLVYIFKRAREERDSRRFQDLNLESIETHLRTKRERLMTPGSIQENGILEKIRGGARLVALARKRHGNIVLEEQEELEMAEMVFCLVQTHAVRCMTAVDFT